MYSLIMNVTGNRNGNSLTENIIIEETGETETISAAETTNGNAPRFGEGLALRLQDTSGLPERRNGASFGARRG